MKNLAQLAKSKPRPHTTARNCCLRARAQRCREAGIQVSVRSVSRCLKALVEKGLLQRDGKSYVPTEIGKKRFEVSGNVEDPKVSSQNA